MGLKLAVSIAWIWGTSAAVSAGEVVSGREAAKPAAATNLASVVVDDFSDGNFTHNPSWAVQSGTFEVRNGELAFGTENDAAIDLDFGKVAWKTPLKARLKLRQTNASGKASFLFGLALTECVIRAVARLYHLHRLFGPAPTPEVELERKLRGVRVFPHAGFVHHRHARGQTSLSWRNSVMALPMPRDGLYAVAPSSDTWLGRPKVKDRAISEHQVSVNVAQVDQGFAAALVMDRCQESLRQLVLVASLPDGRVLSWERFVAKEDLILESLDQGFLQITNESFPLLGSKARGLRTLYGPAGKTDYKGWLGKSASDDIVDRLGRPDWLNVDDRMGIRFVGPGETIYHNRHYHPRYRAIADDLVLSRLERPQALKTGEATVALAALLIPEQNHEDTVRSELRILTGPGDTVCLATSGYLAAANFAASGGVTLFRGRRPGLLDVYAGTTILVSGDDLEMHMPLAGRSAQWFGATATLRVDGDVRVEANAAGATYVTNLGKQVANVEIIGPSDAGEKQSLQPGEVKAFSTQNGFPEPVQPSQRR
ncbi:MAG: hypothetical protein GXY83_11820 [Rhodopirellula sp.]|nr:hypothetical protein [Rhodopirellula sp.]